MTSEKLDEQLIILFHKEDSLSPSSTVHDVLPSVRVLYPHRPRQDAHLYLVVVDIPREDRYLLLIGIERYQPMATDKEQKGQDKKKKGWFARFLERIAKENEAAGGRICPS